MWRFTHAYEVQNFTEWVFIWLISFFFFFYLKWGRGLKRVERTLSCCMIWQTNYMLQVSLYSLPEKHSRFIGSIFFFIISFVCKSLKAADSLLSLVFNFSVWNSFLNLHVNGVVAFSEERLSLFFII